MSVSVVIPSYNHRDYVIQAIESVLAQEGVVDLDLIVIDDGSKDGSSEIIREFHRKRGGFRLIARENQGLIRTLNEGLRLARGEYFCELASDDYFPHESLRLRSDYLRSHPECVAVFADGVMVHGTSRTSERLLDPKRRRMLVEDDPIPAMLNGHLPVFSAGLFRTEALRLAGGFDEETFRFYEDLDTPIRLARLGRFGFIDAPLICRRHHDSNVSTTTQHIRIEKVLCYRKLLDDLSFVSYRPIIKRRLVREYIKLGRYLNKKRNCTQADKNVFRSGLRLAGFNPKFLWHFVRLNLSR